MPEVRDFSQYETIVVAVILREKPEMSILATAAVDYRDLPHGLKPHLDVIALHQTSNRWEDVIRQGARWVSNPDFFLQKAENRTHLAIDLSDAPETLMDVVWDLDDVIAEGIVITSEHTTHRSGGRIFVPLKNIAAALIDSFDSGLIDVAGGGQGLDLADTLQSELEAFTIKTADTASALTLAVGLLAWKASEENYDRPAPGPDAIDWANIGLVKGR